MAAFTLRRALRCAPLILVIAVGCKSEQKQEPPAEPPPQPEATPAAAAGEGVHGEEISYEADGVTLKGYLAWDASKTTPRPGVLVVHEWWGHNDYARKRARMLAQLGYTALAVDMYGDGKQAAHPGDAQKFMMAVMENMEVAVKRFSAAKDALAEHATTDPSQIAAIGYCFGGAVVLHMARTGMDLDGVASFHGNLSTKKPVEKGELKAKLLVAHGGEDPFVPPDQVEAFKKEMAAAEADLRFFAFPGAKHAFTNPAATELGKKFELPLLYDKEADEKSWAELEKFLADVFGA